MAGWIEVMKSVRKIWQIPGVLGRHLCLDKTELIVQLCVCFVIMTVYDKQIR